MSQAHCDAMNAATRNSEAVREACASLPRSLSLTYQLSGGPDGEIVHWTVRFDETVTFSLEPSPSADITITGDWARVVRASRAARDGAADDSGSSASGETALLVHTSRALDAARRVAVFEVNFPDV